MSQALPGAQRVLHQAIEAGAEICFANPGTTELPLVAALDAADGIRAVLGLFEGVCTGAADGYARITKRPALTLLHLGPGLANGIANLHNARRAKSPVVNLIGDHASWHLKHDAPLSSDIEGIARTVSAWVRTSDSAESAVTDIVAAFEASTQCGGQIATMIYPADFQSALVGPTAAPAQTTSVESESIADDTLHNVRRRVDEARKPLFLLGASAMSASGQRSAERLADHYEASCYVETFPATIERGGELPAFERLPYFPEQAREVLDKSDCLVLVGAREPVTYFGYPGVDSQLASPSKIVNLSKPEQNGTAALLQLAAAANLVLPSTNRSRGTPREARVEAGALTPEKIGAVLAASLPEDSIVSMEGASCSQAYFSASQTARRHQILINTGGALGQGLACGVGAAIAAPARRVVCLQSDGSAQYTVQALWTMVREALPIVVLIASNRLYGVLRSELERMGVGSLGKSAEALTSLSRPFIDWVSLARGYGMGGVVVETAPELDKALTNAFESDEPFLIEMRY